MTYPRVNEFPSVDLVQAEFDQLREKLKIATEALEKLSESYEMGRAPYDTDPRSDRKKWKHI